MEFHKRGYFEQDLASLKQLYAPRLQAVIKALKTYLPEVSFAEPEGGFFVSITLPAELVKGTLLQRAAQVDLVLTDGRDFFADPYADSEDPDQGARFVRLPFCALTPEQIHIGVQRLASLLQ